MFSQLRDIGEVFFKRSPHTLDELLFEEFALSASKTKEPQKVVPVLNIDTNKRELSLLPLKDNGKHVRMKQFTKGVSQEAMIKYMPTTITGSSRKYYLTPNNSHYLIEMPYNMIYGKLKKKGLVKKIIQQGVSSGLCEKEIKADIEKLKQDLSLILKEAFIAAESKANFFKSDYFFSEGMILEDSDVAVSIINNHKNYISFKKKIAKINGNKIFSQLKTSKLGKRGGACREFLWVYSSVIEKIYYMLEKESDDYNEISLDIKSAALKSLMSKLPNGINQEGAQLNLEAFDTSGSQGSVTLSLNGKLLTEEYKDLLRIIYIFEKTPLEATTSKIETKCFICESEEKLVKNIPKKLNLKFFTSDRASIIATANQSCYEEVQPVFCEDCAKKIWLGDTVPQGVFLSGGGKKKPTYNSLLIPRVKTGSEKELDALYSYIMMSKGSLEVDVSRFGDSGKISEFTKNIFGEDVQSNNDDFQHKYFQDGINIKKWIQMASKDKAIKAGLSSIFETLNFDFYVYKQDSDSTKLFYKIEDFTLSNFLKSAPAVEGEFRSAYQTSWRNKNTYSRNQTFKYSYDLIHFLSNKKRPFERNDLLIDPGLYRRYFLAFYEGDQFMTDKDFYKLCSRGFRMIEARNYTQKLEKIKEVTFNFFIAREMLLDNFERGNVMVSKDGKAEVELLVESISEYIDAKNEALKDKEDGKETNAVTNAVAAKNGSLNLIEGRFLPEDDEALAYRLIGIALSKYNNSEGHKSPNSHLYKQFLRTNVTRRSFDQKISQFMEKSFLGYGDTVIRLLISSALGILNGINVRRFNSTKMTTNILLGFSQYKVEVKKTR